MSKYNLSYTIQSIQHIAIFIFLEIFFFEVKNKQKSIKHNRVKRAPSTTVLSTKIMFQEKSKKLIEF